ncbi:MAG: nucleotide exchange factor GrpE [Desulfobacterales bacterium]|nr:nucleotide exchange factor GrpE [Desulfobacterales bacterium]
MPEGKKIKTEDGSEFQENSTEGVKSHGVGANENREPKIEPVDTAQSPESEVVKDLRSKLEAKTGEAEENFDRLLRVSAEFENYKKRTAREMVDFQKYANQSLLRELLPIIDNLELAIKAAAEAADSTDTCLLDGVELTRKEILKVFENFHVEPIEALGKPFDPNFHEAVMREESDEHPENTVVNELQKGYLMHDRLLRPSMVVVAMPKNKETP